MRQEISDFYDMEMSQRDIDPHQDELISIKAASVHLRAKSGLDSEVTFYRDMMASQKL